MDEVQRGWGVEVGGQGLVVGVACARWSRRRGGGRRRGRRRCGGGGSRGGRAGGRAVVWVRGGGFEGEGGRGVVVFHCALVVDGSSCAVEESRLLQRQVKKMEKGTKVRWRDACHVDAADLYGCANLQAEWTSPYHDVPHPVPDRPLLHLLNLSLRHQVFTTSSVDIHLLQLHKLRLVPELVHDD